jgi:hypothetical protein
MKPGSKHGEVAKKFLDFANLQARDDHIIDFTIQASEKVNPQRWHLNASIDSYISAGRKDARRILAAPHVARVDGLCANYPIAKVQFAPYPHVKRQLIVPNAAVERQLSKF